MTFKNKKQSFHTVLGKDVQRKWNNLLECYRKNLKTIQKLKRTEDKIAQAQKYVHFNELRFFLGTTRTRNKNLQSSSKLTIRERNFQNRQLRLIERRAGKPQETRSAVLHKKPTLEKCKQNVYMNMDEDECFLMSLLPAMRRFEDDHKFAAKIEIMSAVKKVIALQKAAKPSACPQKHWPSILKPTLQISSTSTTTVKPKTKNKTSPSTGLQNEEICAGEAYNSDSMYDDIIYLDETMLSDSEIKCEEEE